jgi:pumilio RNA-binding family
VARIIKSSDQQASIFLQQKLKVADLDERHKIVDAICVRGFEMMSHRLVCLNHGQCRITLILDLRDC